VRKFFCDVPSCERRIFAERLKDVAHVYARGTERQREALEWIAFALGGEAGARLARQLGVHVSPDTLLNRIREAFCADAENVRVLSVDDFGLGRDNAPGTILVDLERHKIVDLLGEHSVVAVSSYVSAQIVTPAPEQATRFARADLVFTGSTTRGLLSKHAYLSIMRGHCGDAEGRPELHCFIPYLRARGMFRGRRTLRRAEGSTRCV
jgi:hypothetical protein